VLHAALDQAVEWKLITDNPADGITPPRVERGPLKALTRDQARAFREAARGEPLELALRLLLSLGLRRGEVAGLRRCDIDFENGRLHVNGTLTYIEQMGLVWDTPEIYISLYQDTLDDTAERVERILDDEDEDATTGRAEGAK
jgi:integrase